MTANNALPRVCVIGAGAAGLVALRHLMQQPPRFEAIAYERTKNIGGTWVYNPATGVDEFNQPIHSSMYKQLRTNLPKEVMAFPDFPFSENLRSFITHEEVLKYLEDYSNYFNLKKSIQFLTKVDEVVPVTPDCSTTKWQVTVSPVNQPTQMKTSVFDAVMVCNGHYSNPLIPKLDGLTTYKGNWLHSHDYRQPTDFTGQKVLCLGAASSGIDITLDLAPHAKQVYLSHRKPLLRSVLPSSVYQVPGIKRLSGDTIVLEDDTELEVDTLIFCTGYHYSFPFLTSSCKITVNEQEHMQDLYKHSINVNYPSMIFIGIPKTICPFPQFDVQVQWFVKLLKGEVKLPSRSEMLADTEKDIQMRLEKGMPSRHLHHMGALQWEYNDIVAELAGIKPIPRMVQKLYNYVHEIRAVDVVHYKEKNYKTVSEDNFVTLES